jgi:hypothetical protein
MQKTEVYESTSEQIKRLRWERADDEKGAVLVLFVGIHGNEPAGVRAADQIVEKIEKSGTSLFGSVYVMNGNTRALKEGVRFLDTDLNRLWETFGTSRDYGRLNGSQKPMEYIEGLEIKEALETIVDRHQDKAEKLVFADLHTTSSQSCAFVLLNDTLANRDLAKKFPVPQILGIEENIRGTLLSYINNMGHIAIGFEAGSHTDAISVERSEAFLWLLMEKLNLIELPDPVIREHEQMIQAHPNIPDTYYEILHHKIVDDPEKFIMISGFENFDQVEKGDALAYEDGELLRAPESGRIFMPLYQKKGHDGFLIIRPVSPFWLTLSGYLRRSPVHSLLQYLPGVQRVGSNRFEIDLRVARFLVKEIFHLLGYRVIEKDSDTLICYRR